MSNKQISIKEKMKILCADFSENAANAITQLEQLAAKLCADEVSSEVLHEIHGILHRLAGSAGTFGFHVLSENMRLLDTQVLEWMSIKGMLDSDTYLAFAATVAELKDYLSLDDTNVASEVEEVLCNVKSSNDNERLRILVADDDEFHCQLMETLLTNSFDVVTAHSGTEALTLFINLKPDIVLLDIEMSDMDGYHVCERIRQEVDLEWRSIIFVSGCDSLAERMAAFDAGGHDFIAKPFHSEEFFAKLMTLADFTRTKKEVAEQGKATQTLALEVMTESTQYAGLVEFLQRAMRCESVDSLVDLFFETAEKYNLNTSLCLRAEETKYMTSDRLPCSPIEMSLFDLSSSEERLFHFGNRTIVNDAHVSFFVKNMPVEDEKEFGRVKDVIAALSDAMESAFLAVHKKEAFTNAIERVGVIKEKLTIIFSPASTIKHSLEKINQLICDLEGNVGILDLSEEQEETLYGILDNNSSDVTTLMDAMYEVNENVDQLTETLRICTA